MSDEVLSSEGVEPLTETVMTETVNSPESDDLEQWLAKVREKQVKLIAALERGKQRIEDCKLAMNSLSARFTRVTAEMSTLSDRLRKVENDLDRQRYQRGL